MKPHRLWSHAPGLFLCRNKYLKNEKFHINRLKLHSSWNWAPNAFVIDISYQSSSKLWLRDNTRVTGDSSNNFWLELIMEKKTDTQKENSTNQWLHMIGSYWKMEYVDWFKFLKYILLKLEEMVDNLLIYIFDSSYVTFGHNYGVYYLWTFPLKIQWLLEAQPFLNNNLTPSKQ